MEVVESVESVEAVVESVEPVVDVVVEEDQEAVESTLTDEPDFSLLEQLVSEVLSHPDVILFLQLMDTNQFGRSLPVPNIAVPKFTTMHGDAYCMRNFYLLKMILGADGNRDRSLAQWCDTACAQHTAGLYRNPELLSPEIKSFSGNFLLAMEIHDASNPIAHIPEVAEYKGVMLSVFDQLYRIYLWMASHTNVNSTRALRKHEKLCDLLSIFTQPIRFSVPIQGVPLSECKTIEQCNTWVQKHRPSSSNTQVAQIDTWDRVFMYYGWHDYIDAHFPKVKTLMYMCGLNGEVGPCPSDSGWVRRCVMKQWSVGKIYEIDRPLEWLKFRNRPDQLPWGIPDFWWGTKSYRLQRREQFKQEFHVNSNWYGVKEEMD